MALPATDALKRVPYALAAEQQRIIQEAVRTVTAAVRLELLTRINPEAGPAGAGMINGGPGQAIDLYA